MEKHIKTPDSLTGGAVFEIQREQWEKDVPLEEFLKEVSNWKLLSVNEHRSVCVDGED